jgi:prepilin-type N-terminal cleavage/methylation domain-containing protein
VKNKNMPKHAFTMIELIFVIIILGIVSSVGSSIIAQVYESYIVQKAIYKASNKSALAIDLIASRLVYRIDESMLARIPGNTGIVYGTDVYPINEVPIDDNSSKYKAMEWIGYDNDSFATQESPVWSGFNDLDKSNSATISTTESNLNNLATIRGNLGQRGNPGLFFMGINTYRVTGAGVSRDYDTLCMYQNNNCLFSATVNTDTNLSLSGDIAAGEMIYSEFYQIASTAYAVVPENDHNITGRNGNILVWDLALYYNYQPWEGENYTDGQKSILIKDVSIFRFKQESGSIRLKICALERISQTDTIAICKEKAVIR